MGAGHGIKIEQILWSPQDTLQPRQQGISPTPPRPAPALPHPAPHPQTGIAGGKGLAADLLWFLILRLGKHQASLGDIFWGTWEAGKTLDEPDKALSEG